MNEHARVNEAQERDGPSLFTGIALEVEEITLAGAKIGAKCDRLSDAFLTRHEASVKEAADAIAEVAGQIKSLSAHLSSVIARHQARQTKLPK